MSTTTCKHPLGMVVDMADKSQGTRCSTCGKILPVDGVPLAPNVVPTHELRSYENWDRDYVKVDVVCSGLDEDGEAYEEICRGVFAQPTSSGDSFWFNCPSCEQEAEVDR